MTALYQEDAVAMEKAYIPFSPDNSGVVLDRFPVPGDT
jgi:hypothetical protein